MDGERRLPRLVDVLRGELLERGQVLADVVAVLVGLLAEGDGGVDAVVLVEERRGREPHPVAGVQRPIGVQEQLLEDLLAWGI